MLNPTIDIVIPVYREGRGIVSVLENLRDKVRSPVRYLICHDSWDDPTLVFARSVSGIELECVLNEGKGVHAAILTGFRKSTAAAVIMYPADDSANAGLIDSLIEKFKEGNEIVAPSRFMKGGCMVGCPWLKGVLVRLAAFTLHHLARLPVHDPTNGFRLFSRRALTEIPIESNEGFTYSLEILVKAHRRGWKIAEVPALWFERKMGKSRFRVFGWARAYLRWYFYAYQTTWLVSE